VNIAYMLMDIDTSRKDYTDAIRVTIKEIPELINKAKFYDCRNDNELEDALERFKDVKWRWHPRRGHYGVWASTLSAWEYIANAPYDGVIVFESDSNVHKHFDFLMNKYVKQLPAGWDFFSIHNPHNQDGDFHYEYGYLPDGSLNGHVHYPGREGAPYYDIGQPDLCRSFQGYGGCAIMYSPAGAQKWLRHIKEKGIWSSSDCQIFQASRGTEPETMLAVSVKPTKTKPAGVDVKAETQIHASDYLSEEWMAKLNFEPK